MQLSKYETALEAALLEYVEKYGLTEKARTAFDLVGNPSARDGQLEFNQKGED